MSHPNFALQGQPVCDDCFGIIYIALSGRSLWNIFFLSQGVAIGLICLLAYSQSL
jgi:hypothetical protein